MRPLATRAVFTFTGFPQTPPSHLYLNHDGYPAGAAWRFATAQHHHPDADQAVVANLAAVKHRLVTDRDAAAEGQGRPRIGMQHRPVLDIAVFPESDQLIVAAQHRAEPDTGAGPQNHIA